MTAIAFLLLAADLLLGAILASLVLGARPSNRSTLLPPKSKS